MRSIRPFLVAGALGGVCGGVAAAIFQWLVTESEIRAALEIEHALSPGDHDHLFGRTTQVVGGMLATAFYGIAVGLVFGVVLARVWHLLGRRSILFRVASVGGCAYLAWSLVPMLKYPPNPPGVGDPDTVGTRTVEFLTFLGASVVLVVVAALLWGWASGRGIYGAPRAGIAVAAYGLLLAVCLVLWPGAVSADALPADLIWRFRIDSLVQTALLWIVLALATAAILEASVERAPSATSMDEQVHRTADT